jgi:hypothetical protein
MRKILLTYSVDNAFLPEAPGARHAANLSREMEMAI